MCDCECLNTSNHQVWSNLGQKNKNEQLLMLLTMEKKHHDKSWRSDKNRTRFAVWFRHVFGSLMIRLQHISLYICGQIFIHKDLINSI